MTTRVTGAFWALLLVICFVGLDRDLWTPDEPREAAISREMWLAPAVVPSLNGESFIEKPPLYYWAVAGVFALLGDSSEAAARGVSAAASFSTLMLVFFWGRREFSTAVGVVAALGLATSAQFMLTSHWIVTDPLLMLFTTVALLTGFESVRGRGTGKTLLAFYMALVLSLWTKGLIGPLLVAAGMLAYAAARRDLAPLARLRPILGTAVMLAATAVLATLIGADAGSEAVREWFWVNHVLRFVAPTHTGHEQPFYYYLLTLPTAVFPWWLALAAVLRRDSWTPNASLNHDAKVYLAALSAGMMLLLSAAATKRGLYLLPVLPPLLLLLAATAVEWWARAAPNPLRTRAWWTQIACVVLFAVAPVTLALAYLRTAEPVAVGFVTVVGALAATLAVHSWRGDGKRALRALGACAVAAVVGWLVVTTHLASPFKDLTPFVAQLRGLGAPSDPVHVVGDFDETVRGIVPFVTGRAIVPLATRDVASLLPSFVLVHVKNGDNAPTLAPRYRLIDERRFGPDRYMALWERGDGATGRAGRSAHAAAPKVLLQ